MLAIIKTGGKQYKVKKDDILLVEKLEGKPGDLLKMDNILMIQDSENNKIELGSPIVKNAIVETLVLDQIRDKKVLIFKKKRRHNYRRKKGHRQFLTKLKIERISLS